MITEVVKQREADGYSYESSDASFELLLRDELGLLQRPFRVQNWRVLSQFTGGVEETAATVKLTSGGREFNYVGEGNGPVNALDHALRRALMEPFPPEVEEYELTDYRVRILDQGHGTDAIVRVLIDTTDGTGSGPPSGSAGT